MLGETFFDDLETQVVEKKQKKNKNLTKKSKKQKHQNIMKALPPSCFSCAAHSTDYLRLIPQPAQTRPTCKSCGFKLNGKLGYLVCPKLVSCYVLCSSCKVCTGNHILRKMFSLNHFSDIEIYSKNQFKCHGCNLEKEVDPKRGVYHCHPCSFSICPDCIANTDALWEEKNLSSDEQDQSEEVKRLNTVD